MITTKVLTSEQTTTQALTWTVLTEIEPRLLDLERRIKAVKRPRSGYFCANDWWYGRGGFKRDMLRLVGWDARSNDARITTPEAYDLAYHHLYNLLPDCRGCACL
jgi:hypothetical protein